MDVEAFCDLAERGQLAGLFARDAEVALTVDGVAVAKAMSPSAAGVVTIRGYVVGDESAVVALWEACGLTRPWNDARRDIARKLADGGEGFFVADLDGMPVGTAMVGYDGHRGWINYLAVDPARRRSGIGRALIVQAEAWLLACGCPKLNLQIRTGNELAMAFYKRLGYALDDVVCFGKRLVHDDSR